MTIYVAKCLEVCHEIGIIKIPMIIQTYLMRSLLESHFSESTSLLLSAIDFAFYILEKSQTFGVMFLHLSMTKSTNL